MGDPDLASHRPTLGVPRRSQGSCRKVHLRPSLGPRRCGADGHHTTICATTDQRAQAVCRRCGLPAASAARCQSRKSWQSPSTAGSNRSSTGVGDSGPRCSRSVSAWSSRRCPQRCPQAAGGGRPHARGSRSHTPPYHQSALGRHGRSQEGRAVGTQRVGIATHEDTAHVLARPELVA